MTENEIIDFLEDEINGLEEQKNGDMGEIAAEVFKEINGDERIKVFRTAITVLKEIQQYREIGTVEECRVAVEKQKAKKPDIYTDTRNMVDLHGNVYAEQANVYLCPTCESFIGYVGNNIFHYCPVCGQAIDENLEGMEDE